jgi:DNA polymerase-3 subunit epsilon
MHALWDVSLIRRCTTKGKGCSFAELGTSVCPHAGTVTEADYHDIVSELIDARDHDAGPSFERMTSRMARLVEDQRFEDAAMLRDRWNSLNRAFSHHRAWTALQKAGRIDATGPDGVSVAIRQGHLAAAWRHPDQMPLLSAATTTDECHAASLVASEEAALIWKWMNGPGIRIDDVTGTLTCPSIQIPILAATSTD